MLPLAFKQRPDSAVPVRFFVLGLLGFLALCAGVLLLPAALTVPPGPHGVFLLHLAVLGWITPVMIGADYQLLPVVLHRSLVAPAWAAPIFGVYAVGVTVFLSGWAFGHVAWIALGGTAAGIALMGFCVHAALTLRRLREASATALGLAGGLAFLAVVAVLGPWMALAVGGDAPAPVETLLPLHAAAGLGGWLLLTIIGASYQLAPFFAATEPSVRARWSLPAVALVGAGVLLLLASVALPAPAAAVGAGLALAGVTLWAWDIARLARHGRQARREPVTLYTLLAVAALWLAVAGAVAALAGVSRAAAPAAYLGLVAGPSLLILGQLQKILPFIAALDVSQAAKRRGQVPKTEALFPRRRAFLILCGLAPGTVAVAVGLGVGSAAVVRSGAALVLLAAVAFVAQETRALAAWRRARAPAPS